MSELTLYDDGLWERKYWVLKGRGHHRMTGPSTIYRNGRKQWNQQASLFRDSGTPYEIFPDGSKRMFGRERWMGVI